MLNQLQRGDEPALLPCRRSGFLRRPYLKSFYMNGALDIRALEPFCLKIASKLLRAFITVSLLSIHS